METLKYLNKEDKDIFHSIRATKIGHCICSSYKSRSNLIGAMPILYSSYKLKQKEEEKGRSTTANAAHSTTLNGGKIKGADGLFWLHH